MEAKWKPVSLREAGVSLIDCDHRTPPAADAGFPYVAIPQLKEGRLALADVRRISPEHFVEWTRKAKPQHHDVILSRRCNPGETAYVPSDVECALGQNLVLLRADGLRVFPPFLRWLVRGPDWWEQVGTFINVGAVFDSLRCADIPNFKIPLPPLAEQKAIASVLGALDEKIELNRRINATLEAMARTLFQSWFVDFDPVLAKLDGREPAGVDAATAALFPDSFDSSNGGPIPRGWSRFRLRDVADVYSGGTPSKAVESYWHGPLPWISPKAMTGIHVDESDEHVSVTAIGNGTRLVPRGTVLVMVRGMGLHQSVRISQAQRDVTFNQDVKAIVAKSVPSPFLLYGLLNAAPLLFSKVHASGHGTGVLSSEFIDNLEFTIPPRDVLNCITKSLTALNSKIAANYSESRTLAALRDTLLPKLMSGEMRVSHESQIEMTV